MMKYKKGIALAIGAVAIAAGLIMFSGLDVAQLTSGRDAKSSKEKAASAEVERFSLSNGMEVVLVANHRIHAVSHTLWLKTGAADDPLGKSGLAHYLEHLLFKGTPTHPAGRYDAIIEGLGGQFNAFTGTDYTGYYVTIAKEHLAQVMILEADRMRYLLPSDSDFAKERDVIIEERKSRVENQPRAKLNEAMNAALFRHHPYRIPIIGWMHEMEGLTGEDAKWFYDTYYNPANMVLVVAGDIERNELQHLAEKHYGVIPARKVEPRNWVKEPPQEAARLVRLRHEQVQQPMWVRSYIAPSLVEGERKHAVPLEVLAQWLGGGKTSVLYRELVVRQKIATAVSVDYSPLTRGPSDFSIRAVPANGVSLASLRKAVDVLLMRVRNQRIAADDLVRIKTLLKADAIYARDGLEPVAQTVGVLRVLGLSEDYFIRWAEHIDAVSAEEVRDAAQAVLHSEASVTGELLPPLLPEREGVKP